MDMVLALLAAFAVSSVVTWVTLLIVVPIAQKVAKFGFPPWPETLWKLAVIALAVNGVTVALGPISGFLGWLVGFIVFWVLMVKWFQVDLWGALIIVIVAWLLRLYFSFVVTIAVMEMWSGLN